MSVWRVILLLVLVVMLPVRGALAVSMGMAGDVPPSMAHSVALADAPYHTQPTDLALADQVAHSDDSHNAHTHLLCDVCNALAFGVSIPVTEYTDIRPTYTHQRSERFSSVVLPTGHKPPILA